MCVTLKACVYSCRSRGSEKRWEGEERDMGRWRCGCKLKGTGRDFPPVFPHSALLLFEGWRDDHIWWVDIWYVYVYLYGWAYLGITRQMANSTLGTLILKTDYFLLWNYRGACLTVRGKNRAYGCKNICRNNVMMEVLCQWINNSNQCVLGWFRHHFMWKLNTSVFQNI